MEDYVRGLLCGYLTVQTGTRNDSAKRRRVFAVLSDSRMDFYVADPRPEFKAKIADAYIFKPGATQANYYAELHPRAPPHSISLTTDKVTEVYVAESDREAKCWLEHLNERLEALASMVRGTLLIRKELSAEQQLKRAVFKTKYRWKARYVELGRASLRFCKMSERRTKSMNQFTLTATSFVGEEGVEYLKRLRVFASYSVPVVPSARVSRQLESAKRLAPDARLGTTKNSYGISITGATKCAGVSVYYPFIVATGETFLVLSAATERSREEWITAIRMRIISLKYRHNNAKEAGSVTLLPKIQGFVDTIPKPGGTWKRRWVELENGILRVKSSERRLGAIVETRLVPTCQVTPALSKANAFVVSNLGKEIAFAPVGMRESSDWMQGIVESAKAVSHTQYRRAFDLDIQQLMRCSVVYTLVVHPGDSASLVLEKTNKRLFVVSHHVPVELGWGTTTRASSSLLNLFRKHRHPSLRGITEELVLPTDLPPLDGTEAVGEPHNDAWTSDEDQQLPIPRGSVLVGVKHFGMLYDSFDNMWHRIRQKKLAGSGDSPSNQQLLQPMQLLFRAPIEKASTARVKYRPGDDWALAKCRLANGVFSVSCVRGSHELLVLPLRFSFVELVSDENCPNCLKISCTVPSHTSPSSTSNDPSGASLADEPRSVSVFMKVELDADLFVWFEFLSLEIAVARDGHNFPMAAISLDQAAKTLRSGEKLKSELPSCAGYASDQQHALRRCRVIGDRLHDIESDALENEAAVPQRGEFEEFCAACGARGAESRANSSSATNNAEIVLEEKRAAPTQSRIPALTSGREAPEAFTDDEVRRFFQQIGNANGGHVGFAELARTLTRLTAHLRLPTSKETPRRSVGNLLGRDFCSAVRALTAAGTSADGLGVPFEAFEAIVKHIQHPEVLKLARRFAHGEVHIL